MFGRFLSSIPVLRRPNRATARRQIGSPESGLGLEEVHRIADRLDQIHEYLLGENVELTIAPLADVRSLSADTIGDGEPVDSRPTDRDTARAA